MAGDVDARFGHDADRVGIQAVRLDAGGVRLDDVALEMPGPPFGHLAAAGVAGAQEKDVQLSLYL